MPVACVDVVWCLIIRLGAELLPILFARGPVLATSRWISTPYGARE